MLLPTGFCLLALVALSSCGYTHSKKMSNSIVKMSPVSASEKSSRNKRATRVDVSPEQQQELLDIHNKLRRLPKSSDMRFMIWNDVLAQMAQDWANHCKFEHGNPTYANAPYEQIGQNIYQVWGSKLNLTKSIQDFYDEIIDYTYDTGACTEGKMCGHYTQVVWSTSYEVGCGIAKYPNCEQDSEFLVCNYGPAGNWQGVKPFKKGAACTQCDTGNLYCVDGLCVTKSQCDSSAECQCMAKCYNCATYNSDTCSCTCDKGWRGVDCREKCEDTDPNCGANPGWPRDWCAEHDYVHDTCHVMCGTCEPGPSSNECEPVGPGPNTVNEGGRHMSSPFLVMTYIIIANWVG